MTKRARLRSVTFSLMWALAVGVVLSVVLASPAEAARSAEGASAGGRTALSSPLGGAGYTSLVPARVLDTRVGEATVDGQAQGGGAVGPGQTLTFRVTGRAGVPVAGVDAVVLVVTATDATADSFVTVYPAGSPRPTTSNLNPTPGHTTANTVVARVGAAGQVSIYNDSGSVQVIADVHGWFPSSSSFTSLEPARLMDTRPSYSTIDGQGLGAGAVAAGQTVDLQVTGRGGVPASGVTSVVVNVTAVNQTAPTFVSVHPTGSPRPNASSLNPMPGLVTSNVVVATVGAGGRISLYNNAGSVNLIVDVQGWFAPGAGFTPVGPARLVDTRPGFETVDGVDAGHGSAGPGSVTTFRVTGRAGMPTSGVGAVALNVTAVDQTLLTYLTAYPAGAPRPTTSVLNPEPGLVASNLVIAKVGPTGEVSIYNNQGSLHVIVDVVGWFPSDVRADADTATVAEDVPAAAINVLANDTDRDGGPLTIASATDPAHGVATLIGGTPGSRTSVVYQPDPEYCGPDSFSYTLNGGASATVSITVTCVDDAPVAVTDTATVLEDAGPTSLTALLGNDTDIDGGPLAIGSVTQPGRGTVTVTGGGSAVDYEPDPDACTTDPASPDIFTYSLAPGGSTGFVRVTVTCVNDAPSFAAGPDQSVEYGSGAHTVAGWATAISAGPADESDQAVDFVVTNDDNALFSTQPSVSTAGTLSFTVADGASGSATVTVHIHDDGGTADGGVDTSAVQTFVIFVNTPPTAAGQSVGTIEDQPVVVTVSGADVDGDPLTFSVATGPSAGSLGTFSTPICAGTPSVCTSTVAYTPDPDANGTDVFTFVADDGGAPSAPATVDLTVDPVNDAPSFTDGGDETVLEDAGPQTVTGWASAISPGPADEAAQLVTFSVTNDNAGLFSAAPSVTPDGDLTFTPAPDAFGSAEVVVTPHDDGGTADGGSDVGTDHTFTITVTPVNDAPTFTLGTPPTVDEDAGPQTFDPWATGISPGSGEGAQSLMFTVTSDTPSLFSAGPAISPAGVLTFTPAPDAFGTATVTVSLADDGGIADGGADTSAEQTFDITVSPIDDAPTAVDDVRTVAEDSGLVSFYPMDNDPDADGGPMSITAVTQPANGTTSVPDHGASVRYLPNWNYCNTQPGGQPDTFTYTLAPGGSTATVSVTVTCVDDAPIAIADSATVTEDDAATDVDVLANDFDFDGGPISIASVTQPAGGTVAITGGGTGLTYEPDPNACNAPPGTTPDTFTYELAPGGSTATVSVTVTCLDDAPGAVNDTAAVAEDAPATAIDVLVNDTDVDGGPVSITSVTQPDHGTVALTGGGTGLTYEPAPDYCNDPPGIASDTFSYTLAPGGAIAIVRVTVTCVPDDPTAVDDSATVAEDSGTTTLTVLDNDTNPDSVTMSIASITPPANGIASVSGGGQTVDYVPNGDDCNDPPGTTPDTFTYTLTPGGTVATVSVTVTCVDDPPVAVDDSATVLEDATATAIEVLTTDNDVDGGPRAVTSVTQPDHGTVAIAGGGAWLTYEPAPDYCNDPPGTERDTFTYTLAPGADVATVSVRVTCTDDPPVAVDDSATILEDAAATSIDVLVNDTDTDGGPKTVASVATSAGSHGTVVITGGGTGLTYQPDPNYCNDPPGTTPATFTYTLNGGSTGTVSVTVTCVNDAPTPDNETFSGAGAAVGNTLLVVDDPTDGAPSASGPHKAITGDILDGDTDVDGPGPLVVQAGTFATNDGGSVTIQADGDFLYTPVAGTSCTDTSDFFDYTVSDQATPVAGTATGRVTISISGCVWYVSNNAPGNAGTSSAPFDTLAQADTASPAGSAIFVFDGDNTTTGYDAGVDLAANQALVGEAADLVVGGATLHTAVPANRPTITDTNADVVVLDDANTVTGLDIDPAGTGGGIAGGTGDVSGTIANVNIADSGTLGTQPGIELDATTGTWTVSDVTVSTSGATGVRLNSAGTVNFASAGTVTITTSGAKALDAASTSFGTASVIDAVTVTSSGAGAVSLQATSGTLSLGDGAGTDLSLTTTSGATAALLSTHTGTLTVDAAGTDTISATGGPAIDVTNAATLQFDDVDATNSAGDGVNLASFGSGTFSAPTGSTITGVTASGAVALDIDGGNGAITFDGTVTASTSARTVEITNRSGGTVDLNGAITDTGAGINLASNTGATIRFDGGVSVSTSASVAFNATGGGTVVVPDTNGAAAPNNTLSATSATALNVANTTIGSEGLTFRSISSGNATAAADPVNGVVLSSTGSSGGLTVTGDGATAASGGTIRSTTGHGINLSSTRDVSLAWLDIQSTGGSGINGTGVTNFSIVDSTIASAGNSGLEGGITFNNQDVSPLKGNNIAGLLTVRRTVITSPFADGIAVDSTDGTVTDAQISDNVISNTGAAGRAISLVGTGTGSTRFDLNNADIDDNTITNAVTGIQVNISNANVAGPGVTAGVPNDPNQLISITGNTVTVRAGGTSAVIVNVGSGNAASRGRANVNISNNPSLNGANNGAISSGTVVGIGNNGFTTMTATVNNNTIDGNHLANSVAANGIGGGNGITNSTADTPDLTLTASNNVIRDTDGNGILLVSRGVTGVADLKVTANNVAAPLGGVRPGIRIDAGNGSSIDDAVCLNISGNTSAGSGGSQGIGVRKQGTIATTNDFGLQGIAPAPSTAQVVTFLQSQNPAGSGALVISGDGYSTCTSAPS